MLLGMAAIVTGLPIGASASAEPTPAELPVLEQAALESSVAETTVPTAPSEAIETSRSGITPLVPARLVDTRAADSTIDGKQSGGGSLPADHEFVVDVAGRGGVPSDGASAVMLNVSIVRPSTPGYATVYPATADRPLAASLNHGVTTAVANQVLVRLGDDGRVAIYHRAAAHLVVDVVGWVDATGEAPTLVPARLLDTRPGKETVDGKMAGIGRVGADRSVPVSVIGRGGVPVIGAGSVVISVTAVNPSANGFLTVYADGDERPNAASLNYSTGSAVANQVVAELGGTGRFRVYTSSETDIVVDVVGWLPDDSDVASLVPSRLLDTRPGMSTIDGAQAGAGPIRGGTVLDVQVGGRAGVAERAGSVILNVAAVRPSASGFLTVYPSQDELPEASSLNFAAGQNIANQVLVQLGDEGKVRIYSPVDTDVVVDVVAWLPPGVNQLSSHVVALTEGDAQVELASGGYQTGSATFAMPDGADLDVDEIVVLEDTDGLPFYGRVSAVDGSMVTADEVTLGEVIPSGSFDFVADAETGIIQEDARGVTQSARQVNEAAIVAANSLGISAGNTTVDCAGGDVDIDFDVNGLSYSGSASWGAFYVRAEAFYTPSISLDATGTLPDGGSCNLTRRLFSKDLPKIKFSIGPVPIVITHSLGLEVEVSVEADGDLEISAGATASAKIGARYDGGLKTINEFDLNRRFNLDTKGKATFEVGLIGSYSAALYGVLGFKVWVKPSIKAVVNPDIAKWVVVTAQIDAGIDAELTFEFDLLLTTVGFSASTSLARGTLWGPVEVFSRDRNRTVPMTHTLPAEGVEGQPLSGTVSLSNVPAGSVVKWSHELPAGFSLSGRGNTVTISGTPASSAPLTFAVDASIVPPGKFASDLYSEKVIGVKVVPKFGPGPATVGVGEVGRSFEGTALAVGGKGPYTWSATGLPEGVSLAATTTTTPVNAFVGTTPTASSGTIQVSISDSSVAPDVSFQVPWTVVPAVNIPDVTFPAGDVGQLYSHSITIADGVDAVTHRATGVPYGLEVIRSGRTITIAGTPLVAGTQAYRVDVESRLGAKAATTRYFPIRPPLVLDTTLVTVPVGSAEMQPADGWMTVVGGTGPYTWTVTDLPSGVTFDASQDGRRVRVVGSQPTASVLSFDVTVTDSIDSTPAVAAVSLRSVAGASILTTDLPSGALGGTYAGEVQVGGGRAPYDLKAVGLPLGVSVASGPDNSFAFTGTPTLVGSYRVTLELSDASGRPAVRQTVPVVIEPALALVDGTLPNGVSGTSYAANSTLSVTGGVAPYSWDVTGLPDGLSLVGDEDGPTRTVTGTPTAAGESTVSISVTDSAGSPAVTGTRTFTVTGPLTIDATGAPTTAYTDLDVTGTITSTGGNAPVSYSATGLPDGIVLNATTGAFSGRPTSGDQTVQIPVTYTVTDAANYTVSSIVNLRVIPAIVVDVSSARTTLGTGNLYDGSVSATGGVPPYTYSIATTDSSPVPDFVELNATTGVFSSANLATTAGTHPFRVTVADSDNRSATADFTLVVGDTEPVAVTVTAPANGDNGAALSGAGASATGGIGAHTFSLENAPSWLSINPTTGVLSGTPTGENGPVTFTVKAVAGIFEGTRSHTIDVRDPLAVDVSGIATTGSAGVNYTGSFSWSGGNNPTVTVSGLPTTLTAATGASPRAITGRPLTGGTYPITVSATDSTGRSASGTATITIAAAATLALDVTSMPTSPNLFDPAASYSGTATVSGGVTPYVWSAATGLPAGVTMTTDGATATFSGRPQSSGNYEVGLTVTDAAGTEVTRTVTIEVLLEPLTLSATDLWAIGHRGVTETLGAAVAAGGKGPYTFTASANLPAGLTIDSSTGVVSGTATTVADAVTVTITVTDSLLNTATATWAIEIKEPVVITPPSVPSELSATAFVPIQLPAVSGAPTFSTVAKYPGGSSSTMFDCKLYATGQWGCYGQARTLVGGQWQYHATVTVDIFVTVGEAHGAVRKVLNFTTERITDISLGRDHGCAIYTDSTMKCWGGNASGQLGHAFSTTTTVSTEPVYVTDSSGVPITGWSNVEASANAAEGKEFTCALKKELRDGVGTPDPWNELHWTRSTWCWGYGLDGQLGNGQGQSSPTPVRVRESSIDRLYNYDAYDLVVGGEQACAQTIFGTYSPNSSSQNRAAGSWTNDSVLDAHCWGKGAGVGSASDRDLWATTPSNFKQHSVDIDIDRFGDNFTIGGSHTCLRQNEQYYGDPLISCVGNAAAVGDNGGAGTGLQIWAPSKISAGRAHTCAVLGGIRNTGMATTTNSIGEIRCWGDNSQNQLGSTSTATNVAAATGGPTGTFASVNYSMDFNMLAGGDTTCANTSPPTGSTQIQCWGKHYAGDTAGALATVTIDANSRLRTVGATAACAQNFNVLARLCWGSNANGQMGLGSNSLLGGTTVAYPANI